MFRNLLYLFIAILFVGAIVYFAITTDTGPAVTINEWRNALETVLITLQQKGLDDLNGPFENVFVADPDPNMNIRTTTKKQWIQLYNIPKPHGYIIIARYAKPELEKDEFMWIVFVETRWIADREGTIRKKYNPMFYFRKKETELLKYNNVPPQYTKFTDAWSEDQLMIDILWHAAKAFHSKKNS